MDFCPAARSGVMGKTPQTLIQRLALLAPKAFPHSGGEEIGGRQHTCGQAGANKAADLHEQIGAGIGR